MSSTAHLIDMAALRSKLLVATDILRFVSVTIAAPRTADLSEATIALEEATIAIDAARAHIADAIAMLTPTLNPDASYPDAPRGPVGEAIVAAHQVLLDAGLANPVEILIVQTHDERRIG